MNDFSIGGRDMDHGIVELSSEDIDLVGGGRGTAFRILAKKVADAIAWGVALYEGAKEVVEQLEEQEEEPPPESGGDQPKKMGEEDIDSMRF